MASVTGIDHVRVDDVGEIVRRAGSRVAHNHHVDLHRLDIPRRVLQRLAFADAASCGCKTKDIGRKAPFCQLKGEPRPGRVFEKHIGDGLPRKRGHLFDRPVENLAERHRSIED
jgi:hypothetical protein